MAGTVVFAEPEWGLDNPGSVGVEELDAVWEIMENLWGQQLGDALCNAA